MTTPLTPSDPTAIGPYTLAARIDAGGQGTVYLGHAADGSPAAVKVLTGVWGEDGRQRARFARELAAARRVAPFCTAAVLDADMDAEVPYIASEYVPGPTLRSAVLDEGPRTGAALDRLAIATVTALAAVHEAGVVHRDLKPGNVILGPDGPRVIDFGIARFTDATQQTTTVAGTPAYMAPEQIQGLPAAAAGDMFSWAAVIAFAATGRPAFPGENTMAVIDRVLSAEPDLEGVPERLLPVLGRCLAKDPAARPSAVQVLDGLIGRGPSPSAPLDRTAVLEEASTAVDRGTARIRAVAWVPMPEGGTGRGTGPGTGFKGGPGTGQAGAGTGPDPMAGGAMAPDGLPGSGAAGGGAGGPAGAPGPGSASGAGAGPGAGGAEHTSGGPAGFGSKGSGTAGPTAKDGPWRDGPEPGGATAPGPAVGDRWSADGAPTERDGLPTPGGVPPAGGGGVPPTRALTRPSAGPGGRRGGRRRPRPALVTAAMVAVLGALAALLLWTYDQGLPGPAVPTGSTPSGTPVDTVTEEATAPEEEVPVDSVEGGSQAPVVEEETHEPEWTPPATDCHTDPHAEGCPDTEPDVCEYDPASCEDTTDEGGHGTDGGGTGGEGGTGGGTEGEGGTGGGEGEGEGEGESGTLGDTPPEDGGTATTGSGEL